MARREPADFRRRSDRGWGLTIAVILLSLAVALFGWHWWQARQPAPPAGSVSVEPLGTADEVAPPAGSEAPATQTATTAAPDAPAPKYPIAPAGAGNAPSLAAADVRLRPGLAELLGQSAMTKFLQTDDLVRRTVASVDNLTGSAAPGARWPLLPVPGRFSASDSSRDGSAEIEPGNHARYAPVVRLVESVDMAKAAALYREHYPLFQQAYEELGYPKRYFNDRLVEVIDHLLAAPEPAAPPRVAQLAIKGPYQDPRPRSRYEFTDPEFEALSSGQKMLVRMGLDNEQRVKAKLRELRAIVTAGAAGRR